MNLQLEKTHIYKYYNIEEIDAKIIANLDSNSKVGIYIIIYDNCIKCRIVYDIIGYYDEHENIDILKYEYNFNEIYKTDKLNEFLLLIEYINNKYNYLKNINILIINIYIYMMFSNISKYSFMFIHSYIIINKIINNIKSKIYNIDTIDINHRDSRFTKSYKIKYNKKFNLYHFMHIIPVSNKKTIYNEMYWLCNCNKIYKNTDINIFERYSHYGNNQLKYIYTLFECKKIYNNMLYISNYNSMKQSF